MAKGIDLALIVSVLLQVLALPGNKLTLNEVNTKEKYGAVREVVEMNAPQIQTQIENIMFEVAEMILRGEGLGCAYRVLPCFSKWF